MLEGAALTRFLLEKHGRSWDDVALPGVSLADLDGRIFDEYRHRGVESQRLPPQALNESDETVIERLRLRDGTRLKRAAVLLFHPEPHRFFIEAGVKIGAFRGAELLYQDEIGGDLQSRPHNPRAAHGFYRAGMIEAWGRGIRRIGELCQEAGNPGPTWTREPGGVLCLRFPFSEAYQAADREARQVGDGRQGHAGAGATQETTHRTTQKESGTTQENASTDTRRRIVDLMRDNPRITQTRIAERLGITRDGVAYHFRQLRADRVIRRVGSRRFGHWEVLDP